MYLFCIMRRQINMYINNQTIDFQTKYPLITGMTT